jgi:hypothetical protein
MAQPKVRYRVVYWSLMNPPQYYRRGKAGAVNWTFRESLAKTYVSASAAFRMAKQLTKAYGVRFDVETYHV